MGVKNLWDAIESCKKVLPLHHLQNKRVCIDLSCWMVQLQNVNKSHCATKEKMYLKSLFHRLRALLALNCTLIFVTDGSIPAIKLATYRRRLNSGHEATQDEANLLKGTSLRRNMGSEFSCMIKEAKVLGLALGIPCLDGIEEAEAQCALLNSESLCDGCFTSDSDAFLFGARTVYREICLGEGGHVVCYEMLDIERKLGYGRNSLITLALLLGSDYARGVRGLGLESACQIIKSVGDSNVLQLIASEGVNLVKKTRVSKRQMQTTNSNNGLKLVATEFDVNGGNDNNLEWQNQFSQVIDAYLKPKCHSADSDAVHRVLAQHPFQRVKLQQICFQFFQWPPEKTDEYILPKVAERDLTRFANLRLASSKLGVSPPIDQIPVKCPVSKIVKPRQVMGRECFEVLWNEFEGLETSIVPADLINSACPEKIAEFTERKALEKKQKQHKPRKKKSESTSTVPELDIKLQNLMLEIESVDNAVSSTSLSKATGHINQGYRHYKLKDDTECQTNVANNVAKNEVIDLLSPSPQPRSYKAPTQQLNDKRIDVINLSDSEAESSPEHARKVGNLRLFLASIRDEVS